MPCGTRLANDGEKHTQRDMRVSATRGADASDRDRDAWGLIC